MAIAVKKFVKSVAPVDIRLLYVSSSPSVLESKLGLKNHCSFSGENLRMSFMDAPQAEIHQVGRQMIHLVVEKIEGSNEFLGLMEGGGICLANSFRTEPEPR